MLTYTPMKNLAGIRLEGDYTTLRALNDTIHEMADETRMGHKEGDHLMALAYDARKAYERQRDVIEPSEHYPEVGVRYGVKIIWPVLLLQSRQLRDALGWGPATSLHHASAYDLEAVIESAINDQFGATANHVDQQWRRIDPRSPRTVEKIDAIGAMFCHWKKAERAKRMPVLLACFDSMHSELIHGIMTRNGQDSIAPSEIKDWARREWVDPETGKLE